MTNINDFIKLHSKNISGINIFLPDSAMQFVDILISNNRKILGIDGIYITSDGNRPSMDDSITIDNAKLTVSEIQSKINNFLKSRLLVKDLFFEIVYS